MTVSDSGGLTAATLAISGTANFNGFGSNTFSVVSTATFNETVMFKSSVTIQSGVLGLGTASALIVASSATFSDTTANDVVVISSNGMVGFSGPAPTYSGCGTVTVLSSSVTAQSGAISMGGTPGNTCTVTFAKPFIGTPACLVTLGGSLGVGVFGAQGTTSASSVIGTCDNASGLASCGAGTTMAWHCFGN
jgi:hypothetical protein